jgi:hypothetical protein
MERCHLWCVVYEGGSVRRRVVRRQRGRREHTQKNRIHRVLDHIVLCLVKREQDQCLAVVDLRVGKEREEPVLEQSRGNEGEGGIMIGRGTEETGTYHIQRHEHSLWKCPVHDIVHKVIEHADALDSFDMHCR